MVTDSKWRTWALSGELFLGLGVFLLSFLLISLSGLVAPPTGSAMAQLHKGPALAAAGLLFASAVLRLVAHLRTGEPAVNRFGAPGVLVHLGIAVMTAGIFVSSLTRFEAHAVLAEGQTLGGGSADVQWGETYARRFASPPDLQLAMRTITPDFSGNGSALWEVTADLACRNAGGEADRNIRVHSLFPSVEDNLFLRIKDFGYAPYYRLYGQNGEILDEAFVMMKLFPPGSADSFSLSLLPHTFTLQYDPRGFPEAAPQTGTDSSAPRKAVYLLRVARNLDLQLSTRTVAPYEKVQLGSFALSFDEIRHWAEVVVVRDQGMYAVIAGGFLALSGALRALYLGIMRYRGRGGKS